MRKLTLDGPRSIDDFLPAETLNDDQQKQVKGGDDPNGDGGEVVTHEDVIEV